MSAAIHEQLWPKLDAVRHLALYTAFHRSRGNRVAHGVCTPIVLVSMLFLQAFVRVPSAHPMSSLFHIGTVLTLCLGVVLATIDVAGAALLLAFLLPWCALAGVAAQTAPAVVVIPAAVAVHLLAWYGTVGVGHGKLEPWIDVGGQREDSNVYFRRGYYLGRDVGAEVHRIDGLIQFCIAPLAVAQDVLLLAGLRASFQQAIEAERARVLQRIERRLAPLADGAESASLRSCSPAGAPVGPVTAPASGCR